MLMVREFSMAPVLSFVAAEPLSVPTHWTPACRLPSSDREVPIVCLATDEPFLCCMC